MLFYIFMKTLIPDIHQLQLSKGKSLQKQYRTGVLNFFIYTALDSRRFRMIPFCQLDKLTVKVYEKSARYREYEGAWELLEK